MLGLNTLAGHIGAHQLKNKLHRKIKGDLQIHLKTYSALDLRHGRIKQLAIDGNHLLYDKALYIQSFHLETDPQTPLWLDKKGEPKTPIKLHVAVVLTAEDINKSLTTDKIRKRLSNIPIPLVGLGKQQLKLMSPQVDLSPDIITASAKTGIVGQASDHAISTKMQTGLAISADASRLLPTHFMLTVTNIESSEAILAFAQEAIEGFLKPSYWLPKRYKTSQVQFESVLITPSQITLSAQMIVLPPLAK